MYHRKNKWIGCWLITSSICADVRLKAADCSNRWCDKPTGFASTYSVRVIAYVCIEENWATVQHMLDVHMYLDHSPFTLHHHHSGIRDVRLLTQKLVFRSIKGYDKIEITA